MNCLTGTLTVLAAVAGLGWSGVLCRAAELAAKPVFEVRLAHPVSSVKSPVGAPVRAVVVSPAVADGGLYLPSGTTVYGYVARVSRVGLGLRHERAELEIHFTEAVHSDGRRVPLSASLLSVDNAREQVRHGSIRGILAADSLSNYLFGVWTRPSLVLPRRALLGLTGAGGMTWGRIAPNPYAAAAFIGLRYALVPWPNPEIQLPEGTELRLQLESIGEAPLPASIDHFQPLAPELRDTLEYRPFKVTKPAGEWPGDVINLAFAGSEDQLVQAFQAAGWHQADRLNTRSFRDAYHAFTTSEGYPTAPVSEMHYQGRAPDFVFQKSFNTISKRHHIRVWSATDTNGQSLWLGAASHDIGVDFESAKLSFSHRIDPRLDVERAKVINDLSFADCLDGTGYLERGEVTRAAEGSSKVETDGRLAVVYLGRCAAAPAPDPAAPLQTSAKRPRLHYRLLQRSILETRNYLVRRNAYYQLYHFVRKSGLVGKLAGIHHPTLTTGPLEPTVPLHRTPMSSALPLME
jgi:hypothetical protein